MPVNFNTTENVTDSFDYDAQEEELFENQAWENPLELIENQALENPLGNQDSQSGSSSQGEDFDWEEAADEVGVSTRSSFPSTTPGSTSPTTTPSKSPTLSPTIDPTQLQSSPPSESPTRSPTYNPTATPTRGPTATPSESPSAFVSESVVPEIPQVLWASENGFDADGLPTLSLVFDPVFPLTECAGDCNSHDDVSIVLQHSQHARPVSNVNNINPHFVSTVC